jgi:hypothetical protein
LPDSHRHKRVSLSAAQFDPRSPARSSATWLATLQRADIVLS